MGEVDNRKVVCLLYEEAWGKGNPDAIDEAFAEEHILHWSELRLTDQHRTTTELKNIIKEYRAAFPDLRVTINDMVAEDHKVAV